MSIVKKIVAAAVVLVCGTSVYASGATQLPKRDVNKACSRLLAAVAINDCIEKEQAAYDTLKSEWPQIPESIRRQCLNMFDHVLTDPRDAYYYIGVNACVEPRLEVWRLEQPHSFKP